MTGKSDQFEEEAYLDFATYDWANNVLNGIAYQSLDDSFLITGKMWHHIWKVQIDYRKDIEEYEASKSKD